MIQGQHHNIFAFMAQCVLLQSMQFFVKEGNKYTCNWILSQMTKYWLLQPIIEYWFAVKCIFPRLLWNPASAKLNVVSCNLLATLDTWSNIHYDTQQYGAALNRRHDNVMWHMAIRHNTWTQQCRVVAWIE